MKQKSILVRLLSVVCMVCCCMALVFGAVACSDEAVKAIKSISMNANGDLVIVYTDDSTETVKNNKTEVSVCAHDEIYVMEDMTGNEEYATIEALIKASMDDPSTFDPSTLSADRCRLDKLGICKKCGDVVATYTGHKEEQQNKPATCFTGSYEGVGCAYCSWVKGEYKNDKLEHDMVAVADPIAFQEGLMNKEINVCTDTHYTSVKICQRITNGQKCGHIAIETAEAKGHTLDKEALVESKIATENDTYKLTGTCVDCGASVVAVELPKLAEGDYEIVSGGTKNANGHYVTYKYTGTETLPEKCKFEDGTNTVAFDATVVTTDAFTAKHYITKVADGSKVELTGALNDVAEGVYNNLYLKGNYADLKCGETDAALAASAICEFCQASVDVLAKKAHGESTVKSYGANCCIAEHEEIWTCEDCGDYTKTVAKREHSYALSDAADAVVYDEATDKFTIKLVCEYCGDIKIEEAKNVVCDKAETCGTAGEYHYVDENGKTWNFTKKATGKHVYATGKVVEYTAANKVEYAIAKDYIKTSVFLSDGNAQVVCDKDIEATLVCADCKQAIDIVINRAHVLDKEHSKPQAQTCVGSAHSVEYCAYEDCENKYTEDKDGNPNGTPYINEVLNARHSFVFDKIEGGKLYVKCTVANCPAKETAIEITDFILEETVKNLECADYAAGKTNYNTITFKHTIDGNEEEEYTVIQNIAVKAHKFAVVSNMTVDPAATPNAAEIIKASHIKAGSPAQDCLHDAAYSFICPDCKQSVDIKVKGDHINTDEVVVPASCEEAAYYNCDACTEKLYVDGSVALGHDEKIEVNADGTIATITCNACDLNLTVATKAGLGTDRIATAGEAKNCEDCYYSYKYVNGTYEETFTFIGKKLGGTSHTFLKIGNEAVKFCYVIPADGVAVLFDINNAAHAGLTKYCGNYCTACGAFVPVA